MYNFLNPRNFRGYKRITLSDRLSVQIGIRTITFFCFDIGLLYLAHGFITIRRFAAFIHDPNTTFTFDPKVKLKGFRHIFMSGP